jgi:hypothetical protein
MGREGDKKGISVCIATLPISGKIIARKNYTEYGKIKYYKFFGIVYTSLHAEARVLFTIIRNKKFLAEVKKANQLELTVLRYTVNGNIAPNSKPCKKCQKLFEIFKNKYLPKGKIIINYLENGKLVKLIF